MVTSDFELLDRWRAGDRKAGNELFQRHFDSISRFFENKLADDVDDLVQGTFFALVKYAEGFRKQASFRTYLFTIAKHELYRHLRKRAKQGVDFAVTSLADLGTSAPSKLIRGERKHQLLLALRELPVEQQMLIELHYWEGIALEELATIFEVAPATVRSRLFRARKDLRRRMTRLAKTGGKPIGVDAGPDEVGAELGGLDEAGLEAWARGLRDDWMDADGA